MKYLLVMILCLLSTAASARHVEIQRDIFGNEVHTVVRHHIHHTRHHHPHRAVVHRDVSVPASARPDRLRDVASGASRSQELRDVFRTGFFQLRYPYATGTAILDAYSGRVPVTYCASHTDFIMGW